jgi:hypothetical protein
MSLATLKKKTQSKYKNNSVGVQQFCIHGTHRNQGYIGQTSLSRSFPRTLAKGAYSRGHGGCCGTYTDVKPIISGVLSTEDSSIVKPSVLSSSGMLAKRNYCCDQTVKPNDYTNLNSQSSYLEHLKHKTTNSLSTTTSQSSPACPSDIQNPSTVKVSTVDPSIKSKLKPQCNYVKSAQELNISISQSDYLNRKKQTCNENPEFHRKSSVCKLLV